MTRPYQYRAIVSLREDDGSIIAGIYFIDDPNDMPDADILPDSGQPMSFYTIGDFPRILDILRNEEPVYYWQLSNWPQWQESGPRLSPSAKENQRKGSRHQFENQIAMLRLTFAAAYSLTAP